MVRCFDDDDVVHVAGQVNPIEDIEVINLELILADLQMSENALTKMEKQAKGNKELLPQIETLKKVIAHLNENKMLTELELTEEESESIKQLSFLTL